MRASMRRRRRRRRPRRRRDVASRRADRPRRDHGPLELLTPDDDLTPTHRRVPTHHTTPKPPTRILESITHPSTQRFDRDPRRPRTHTQHTKNIGYDPPSLRHSYTHSDIRTNARPSIDRLRSIDRSIATHLDGSSERRRRRRRCLPTRAPLPARRCPPRLRSTVAARASRRARARARTGSLGRTSQPTWMDPCRGAWCVCVCSRMGKQCVSGRISRYASRRDSDRFVVMIADGAGDGAATTTRRMCAHRSRRVFVTRVVVVAKGTTRRG